MVLSKNPNEKLVGKEKKRDFQSVSNCAFCVAPALGLLSGLGSSV
jgi:hypothetical protein